MIKEGNKVTVHYTGKFEDDKVFDTSNGKDPITFVVGEHQVIAGFEEAVMGKNKGETVNAVIDPSKAYGELRDDLIAEIASDQVPEDVTVGSNLHGADSEGQPVNVTVTSINENNTVTLDANHPLAGKTLVFDIEVVDFE